MLSFFLQNVLKRSLTFAVAWGMAYPTFTGNIVVRNVSLGTKWSRVVTESQTKPMLSVGRVEINPYWSSVFEEVIKVQEAELEDIRAEIYIDDAAKILYCLNNISCLSNEEKQERRERLSSEAELKGEVERRLPLKLDVASFSLRGGEILIRRQERGVKLEVVQGEGRDVFLPLGERQTEVQLDAFLSSFGGRERVPLRAKLKWDPNTEVLDLVLYTRDLPIMLVREVLPELFPADGGIGGELAGTLHLEYRAGKPAGERWRLRS